METRGGTGGPERTGIEGAAVVFAAAAFVNVALALALRRTGWLGEVGALRFLFLGLELAAAGVTTAAVALALGPHRGLAARPAWLAGGTALLLVVGAMVWLLPRLFGPAAL
jgi:hypothetical protein